MTRERLKLGWSVEAQSQAGTVVAWLLECGMKDHALESITAFWYPFAVLQRQPQPPGETPVPTLTAKAEALLAIAKLERQISLLRQTFDLGYTPLVVPMTAGAAALVAHSTPVSPVTASQPTSLLPVATEPPVISGFESFDASLTDTEH